MRVVGVVSGKQNEEDGIEMEEKGGLQKEENCGQKMVEDGEEFNGVHISELPDEVLEYIFKLISPYVDFQSCYR